MADINELTQDVLHKVKAEVEAEFDQKKEKLAARFAEQEKQVKTKAKREKETLDERAKRELERLKQSYNNELRNRYLEEKQHLIHETFAKAVDQMTQMDAKDFMALIEEALGSIPADQATEIVLGERSKGQVDAGMLEKLQEKFSQVSLADHVLPKKAGFILAQKGMDYNFTFDQLIEEEEDTLSQEISRQVFA